MILFNSLLPLFFAVVAFGLETDSHGVVQVLLREQQVLIKARFTHEENVNLLQLLPHEGIADGKRLKPDWQWANGIATARLSRLNTVTDMVFSRFQLIDALSGKPLGQARWVDNIESTASRTLGFPAARGIKGLQCIEDIDDALSLGVKQAALNVTLDQLVDWRAGSSQFSRQVDGETVCFHASL